MDKISLKIMSPLFHLASLKTKILPLFNYPGVHLSIGRNCEAQLSWLLSACSVAKGIHSFTLTTWYASSVGRGYHDDGDIILFIAWNRGTPPFILNYRMFRNMVRRAAWGEIKYVNCSVSTRSTKLQSKAHYTFGTVSVKLFFICFYASVSLSFRCAAWPRDSMSPRAPNARPWNWFCIDYGVKFIRKKVGKNLPWKIILQTNLEKYCQKSINRLCHEFLTENAHLSTWAVLGFTCCSYVPNTQWRITHNIPLSWKYCKIR